MMMDGLDHPKTLDLSARLDVSLPQVIGHLELLWAFVAQKTPRGNIGKWPDGTIARAAQWTSDATVFVTALHEAGFIDASKDHRFVIHDWTDLCPRWVKAKLKKIGETFCSADCSGDYRADSMPSHAKPSHAKPKTHGAPAGADVAASRSAQQKTGSSPNDYSDDFETAWGEYPKRDGGNPKKPAFKAWRARLRSGSEPQQLIDGARRYAQHCEAHGKLNTPYVMQAARFFGPDDAYAEPYPTTPPETNTKPRGKSATDYVMTGFD
jgi:hypothetical protein